MSKILKIILHDKGKESLFCEELFEDNIAGSSVSCLDLDKSAIPMSLLVGFVPSLIFLNGNTVELHLTQY